MTMLDIETTTKPKAPVEIRKATITAVHFPERVIELLVVPYDQWAIVEHPLGSGKFIEESFAPGAFGNVQNRASRFLVNLEHDLDRVVGRAQSLHPDRPEGLGGALKIRRGAEGDQVLTDAEDQMIGASVGYAALPSDIEIVNRSRRRIHKAFLDHIGLTFTPAYDSTMPVAVRSQPIVVTPPLSQEAVTATPNLDAIMLERLAKQYDLR